MKNKKAINIVRNIYGAKISSQRIAGRKLGVTAYLKVQYALNKSIIDEYWTDVQTRVETKQAHKKTAEQMFVTRTKALIARGFTLKKAVEYQFRNVVMGKYMFAINAIEGLKNFPTEYSIFMRWLKEDGETDVDYRKVRYLGDNTYSYTTVKGRTIIFDFLNSPEEVRIYIK